MLLEIAIGDAYGAGYEYAKIGPGHENDLSRYIQHGLKGMPAGHYTDDTHQSIALAEAMIESAGAITPPLIAEAFVRAIRRDPERHGYSSRFRRLLDSVRDGDDLRARLMADSERSGAAMRACPIGLYPTVGEVIDRAALQARVTHDTDKAAQAAVAAALATHYFAFELGPKGGLQGFLAERLGSFWATDHTGPVSELGVDAVRAAVTAIARSSSLSETLLTAVGFTGDVDTSAAIAMGAGHLSPELEDDLPAFLYDDLENGAYGRDWLIATDERLAAAFPCPAARLQGARFRNR